MGPPAFPQSITPCSILRPALAKHPFRCESHNLRGVRGIAESRWNSMSTRSSTSAARILVAMIGLSIFETLRGAVSVAVAGRSGHWQVREPGAQTSISPNQITEKRLLKSDGIPDVQVFRAISWSRRVLDCRDALAGCFAQRQRDLGLRNADGERLLGLPDRSLGWRETHGAGNGVRSQ